MSATLNAPAPTREPKAAPAKAPTVRPRRNALDWILLVLAALGALAVIFPLILIVLNSFKSPDDYNHGGPLHLPTHLYFGGIRRFWNGWRRRRLSNRERCSSTFAAMPSPAASRN